MLFAELLKRLSPILKRITYKLSRSFSSFACDDLYQEAVIHLWLEFNSGTLADKTDSYVLQGSYFYLRNYIRMNLDKIRPLSLEGMYERQNDEGDLNPVPDIEDPHSLVEEVHCRMLIEAIRNNGLTPREKEVFFSSLDGFTTREIGGRLGISHVRVVKLKKSIAVKCRKHMDLSIMGVSACA
jgi:RNA polymerase sigma factor (sigma-70 family)